MFQSTRPARGATPQQLVRGRRRLVSIHAPRAGRDADYQRGPYSEQVSIHAPRAGRDGGHRYHDRRGDVSIDAPRAGRDR